MQGLEITHVNKVDTEWHARWHDEVIKWKYFPRYWPFVREIHRSPVNSPHKGQWHEALTFSLIWSWMNSWGNNREAGGLRRHRALYDVTVVTYKSRHNVFNDKIVCKRSTFVFQSHDRNRDVLKRLRNHVVVCLFADAKSPLVGLCNFVMPLRSSALRHSELKTVVIVGNEDYLKQEWPAVKHFPEIYVKPVGWGHIVTS